MCAAHGVFIVIEKANKHFKKAFNIDLKALLEKQIWEDLIDIVNLRNMMVHNNGRVDEHFKTTTSYQRLKDNIDDKLYRLEEKTVIKYFASVIEATTIITNSYLEQYSIYNHTAIANYYFNNNDNVWY